LTLVTLVLLYGAYAFIDGLTAIWVGGKSRAWAVLLFGMLGVVVGIYTFFYPGVTALALLYLIAAWAFVRGIFEIVVAIQLRKEIRYEWALIVSGLISIIFGIVLVANPRAGVLVGCGDWRVRVDVRSNDDRICLPRTCIAGATTTSAADVRGGIPIPFVILAHNWWMLLLRGIFKVMDQRTMGDKNFPVRRWMAALSALTICLAGATERRNRIRQRYQPSRIQRVRPRHRLLLHRTLSPTWLAASRLPL
jgi:hypothetical protein